MSRPESYLKSPVAPLVPSVTIDRSEDEMLQRRDAASRPGAVFERGAEMVARREHMLVPICLNNGYYTRERVYELLAFASRTSRHVGVFFTDGPARHNYLAIGKTDKEARRECHRHLNRLRNHCIAALERINRGRQTRDLFEASFLDWDSIYSTAWYQGEYRRLLRLYQTDEDFRNDIRRTTSEVLRKKVSAPIEKFGSNPLELASVVEKAVHYSLEELAFLMTYSKHLDFEGFDELDVRQDEPNAFVYVYYQRWRVFEQLVDGVYDGNMHCEIGFHIVD